MHLGFKFLKHILSLLCARHCSQHFVHIISLASIPFPRKLYEGGSVSVLGLQMRSKEADTWSGHWPAFTHSWELVLTRVQPIGLQGPSSSPFPWAVSHLILEWSYTLILSFCWTEMPCRLFISHDTHCRGVSVRAPKLPSCCSSAGWQNEPGCHSVRDCLHLLHKWG